MPRAARLSRIVAVSRWPPVVASPIRSTPLWDWPLGFLGDNEQALDPIGAQGARRCRGPPMRIDNDARRLRPKDAPDRQLWIVGEHGPDPDHDSVNQRTQAMQVIEAVGAVNVMGVPGRRGGPPVKGLPDLPDDGQIVDASRSQRPENLLPFRRGIIQINMTVITDCMKRGSPPVALLRS